jgi:RNA polymerase sigma factor (sigma-70 family)
MHTSNLLMELSVSPLDEFSSMFEGIVRRDEAALSKLYDSTITKVYGLALKITGRHDLAEEVVEDTYMQVWLEIGKFDNSRGPTLAWMMMICRSRAIDALRNLDKAISYADPELLRLDLEFDKNPLDILMMLERESVIRVAMVGLTASQRQLISLAFFKGYTHEEIAEYMSIPLGTVKSSINRSKKILKIALDKDEK